MARSFSTGPRHRPVLIDPLRVTSKEIHLLPSHMWCIGGMVRKLHARPEDVGSNPHDRARAFTLEKSALDVARVRASGASIFFLFFGCKTI